VLNGGNETPHYINRRSMMRQIYTPEIKQKAIEMKKQGKTMYQIATVLGIPSGTVGKWITGINPLKNGYPKEIREEARKLKRLGMSNHQISRKLNIAEGTIQTWTKGIRPRKRYSKEVKHKAYDLWLSGISIKQISRELGIAYSTIRGWINVAAQGHEEEHCYSDEEIAKMIENPEIAIEECIKRGKAIVA